jgi:hypothetical protein
MVHTSEKQYINTATTTQITANNLSFININKTLTGTVTVFDGNGTTNTQIAQFAVGTAPASFHFQCTMRYGVRIVTTAADDILVIL